MEIVEIFKALSDETRIRMLNLIKNGELCVCDIEAVLNIQQSNASRHLNKLKIAGIILADKKAQWVYYRLNEAILLKYPFLSKVIYEELEKIDFCKIDLERLQNGKTDCTSC